MKSDWELRAEKDLLERRAQMVVWAFISLLSTSFGFVFLALWSRDGALRDFFIAFLAFFILSMASIAVWSKRR